MNARDETLLLVSRWIELDPVDADAEHTRSFHRDAVETLLAGSIPDPEAWAVLEANADAESPSPSILVLAAGGLYLASPIKAESGDLRFRFARWSLEDLEIGVEEGLLYSHGAKFRERIWTLRKVGEPEGAITISTEENLSSQAGPDHDELFCRAVATASGWI